MNELFALENGPQRPDDDVMLAAPMMGAALVVGLLVSVFQALTQINEQTLTFVPKILAVFAALAGGRAVADAAACSATPSACSTCCRRWCAEAPDHADHVPSLQPIFPVRSSPPSRPPT